MERMFTQRNFHNLDLPDSMSLMPFRLLLDRFQRNRLKNTCFRGPDVHRAGNFRFWSSIQDVLEDLLVLRELVQEIHDVIKEMRVGNEKIRYGHRFTIEHTDFIGWTSTVPWKEVPNGTEFELFHPNNWTDAYRVTDASVLTPLTKDITITFDVQLVGEDCYVDMKTIYPGDMVEMGYRDHAKTIDWNDMVFFDWEHPGEEL